jgi:hypothetical protein
MPSLFSPSPLRTPATAGARLFLPLWVGAALLALAAAGCDTGVAPTAQTGAPPPEVAFSQSAATVTEGDSTASIDVFLSRSVGSAVSVDVLYGNEASSTDPSDLNLPGSDEPGFVVRTVTFPASAPDSASQTLTFTVTDDVSGEDREEAFFALQNLSSPGRVQLGDPKEFRLEIGFPTLEQVRTQDLGDRVSFRATVTRARGAFTYLQDDSGPTGATGFTVRQTGGDFNAAVAGGDIGPGTRLRVSGTLGQFSGLLQINEDGLADYEILEQGEAPEPQTVTLADLEGEAGEAYEGELVRVEGLTFGASGTFSSGTNYDVSDGTGSLVARIPNASDTQLAGDPIPSGSVTFVGVLGQFNDFSGRESDGGYQLLLIDETDLR